MDYFWVICHEQMQCVKLHGHSTYECNLFHCERAVVWAVIPIPLAKVFQGMEWRSKVLGVELLI